MDEQNTGVDTQDGVDTQNTDETPNPEVSTPAAEVPTPQPDPQPQQSTPLTVREQLFAEGNTLEFKIPETNEYKKGHKLDLISIGDVEFKDLVVGETYTLPKEIVNIIRGMMNLNVMVEGQAHDGL